jgi:glycosyltransferase involved in cell wall biosynthesis
LVLLVGAVISDGPVGIPQRGIRVRSTVMANSASFLPHPVNDPLVTIAIPTFNRAAWLKQCVLSALAQSYPHFEVLVSDNASTDETEEVLKEFDDRRLRVVRQKSNIGLLRNWNACLAEARGEYIVLVPDDDRIAPQMLERCTALVRRKPRIPIVITLSDTFVVALARRFPAVRNQQLETGIFDGTDILEEFLEHRIAPQMCSIMVRTEALRARGGFPLDLPYGSDIAAWAPLLLLGRAGFVNESCATFCVHDASQTAKLAIDVRLRDIRKITDTISNVADLSIGDQQKRAKIKSLAERNFANWWGKEIINEYNEQGAKLAEVLVVLWQGHRILNCGGIGNTVRLIRLLALLLLPGPAVRWIRRFKLILIWKSSKALPDESEKELRWPESAEN